MATAYRVHDFDSLQGRDFNAPPQPKGKKKAIGSKSCDPNSPLPWFKEPTLPTNGFHDLVDDFGSEALAAFGAWVLTVKVAARCRPRGHMIRSNGQPISAARACSVSAIPPEFAPMFERVWAWALTVGWLEETQVTADEPRPDRAPTAGECRTEERRVEESRGEQTQNAGVREGDDLPQTRYGSPSLDEWADEVRAARGKPPALVATPKLWATAADLEAAVTEPEHRRRLMKVALADEWFSGERGGFPLFVSTVERWDTEPPRKPTEAETRADWDARVRSEAAEEAAAPDEPGADPEKVRGLVAGLFGGEGAA